MSVVKEETEHVVAQATLKAGNDELSAYLRP